MRELAVIWDTQRMQGWVVSLLPEGPYAGESTNVHPEPLTWLHLAWGIGEVMTEQLSHIVE